MSREQAENRKIQDRPKKTKAIPAITQELDEETANRPEIGFPVVALGASAGGLEAFTQFLSKLPKDIGMAFILIQHLDPSHPSSLAELLGRQSPIPISEATEGIRIQPDQAYVIPPGMAMSIRNRALILEEQPDHPGLTHSINIFFHSLAEDVKEARDLASGRSSLGLMSMQERAKLIGADLKIDSKPGKGTTITAEVTL